MTEPLLTVRAPFTPEQVVALNAWQTAGFVHEFTCGTEKCRSKLVATEAGWICPLGCGYTQDWAHAGMADPRALEQMRSELLAFARNSRE